MSLRDDALKLHCTKRIVEMIEPVFGGINLEDISAPRCFEVFN